MKLHAINERGPILPDYKAMLASMFTDNPLSSMALEPKDDGIDEIEDEVDDLLDAPNFGRSANYTRLNTNGEDDVRGGK